MAQVYLKFLTFVNSMKYFKIQAYKSIYALFTGTLLILSVVNAQESEVERLSGFHKFKKEYKIHDQERQKAYSAYLEDLEKEAFDRAQALKEYRKIKKTERPLEESKYYQQYLKSKVKEQVSEEENYLEFMKEKKKWSAKKYDRPFTEEYELDLLTERPRFDYKKRASFGAKPKFKVSAPGGGSGSGSSPGAYSPPFDFGGDNGYIPPPPPPMDPFFDDIPPPPPMPMDGMGDFNNDGFIPPPPPPPPMFDGEF